jgi:arabinan endo-1,5-alpha-L-arabinosidase
VGGEQALVGMQTQIRFWLSMNRPRGADGHVRGVLGSSLARMALGPRVLSMKRGQVGRTVPRPPPPAHQGRCALPRKGGSRSLSLTAVFLLCLALGTLRVCPAAELAPATPDPAAASPPRVHDPSTIVHCGGEYWSFCTGTGVLSRRSKDLVSWTPGPAVFETVPAWIGAFLPGHRGHLWAPDVIPLQGRYFLYYSVSTWGKNTSAIALATNATLDPDEPAFAWKDEGIVIQSAATDDFNAIDPALFHADDGRLWMAFGSFWSGIKLVELDPGTGKRLSADSPIYALANNPQIEAAGLAAHDGWHYLFVNWGFCCRGTNSTYEIRMGRSRDLTGPYVDREGRNLREGGGSLFLSSDGRFLGPGHAAILTEGTNDWVSFHFYDGTRRGAPTLGLRRVEWDADGWPRAASWFAAAGERASSRGPGGFSD